MSALLGFKQIGNVLQPSCAQPPLLNDWSLIPDCPTFWLCKFGIFFNDQMNPAGAKCTSPQGVQGIACPENFENQKCYFQCSERTNLCLKCLLNRLSFICLFSIVIFYYKYSIVLYIFFGIINVSWILVVVKYTLLGVLILVS